MVKNTNAANQLYISHPTIGLSAEHPSLIVDVNPIKTHSHIIANRQSRVVSTVNTPLEVQGNR
jgi:hypothetical protein